MIQVIIRKYVAAYSGLSREVWVISMALLINRAGAMVLPFLTLYFRKELGFSEFHSGILLACYGVAAIGGTLLGGKLTTVIGGIRTQYLSLSLTPPMFLLLGQADSFVEVATCMALLAICAEAARPAATTATTQFAAPENHTKALALNRMAVNLGTAIGPAVGGFLATIDFGFLFTCNAFSIQVSLLLLFCNFTFSKYRIPQAKNVDKSVKAISPFADGQFMLFMLLTLLTGIVFFQLICTFPLYLHDVYKMSEAQIGAMMSINTLVIVAFEMVLIDYIKRFNMLTIIGIGSLLSCLGFGLMPFGTGFVFCALTVLVWTMGEMLSMPLTAAMVAQSSNDKNRGEYMGVYTSTYAVALVVAPLIWMTLYRIDVHLVSYASIVIGILVYFAFKSMRVAPVIKQPALD